MATSCAGNRPVIRRLGLRRGWEAVTSPTGAVVSRHDCRPAFAAPFRTVDKSAPRIPTALQGQMRPRPLLSARSTLDVRRWTFDVQSPSANPPFVEGAADFP